jgi:hypothetical protein
LYTAACASCHGDDGRGAPRSRVGFPEELPDFTDCAFASPETHQDWVAVVHEGGPVRAFSHRMPKFGAALSREEIERVVAHVRSLCTERRWPPGELNLPRPMATEKAFPENETVFTASVVEDGGSRTSTTGVLYERRIGARTQWELFVPLVAVERSRLDGGGLLAPRPGDVQLAIKRVLHHSGDRGRILSILGEVAVPTGDAKIGAGSGTAIFEPSLLAGQLLPAEFFVQIQAGAELPMNRDKATAEALFRTALGTTIGSEFGRAWSPSIEFLGTRELETGARVEWDLVPQMQVTLTRRQHIAFAAGYRFPVNSPDRPRRFLAYLLWDWADGGFFEGWR